MTRSAEEVEQCLVMSAAGASPTEIARRTGIPRATVRDWVYGKVPGAGRDWPAGSCAVCGHAEHARDVLPREYVYLLGVYLGDGCLSAHPRGVFRLRITLDARYPEIIREASGAVAGVSPSGLVSTVVRRDNCVEVSSYSKAWPCLLPQHGPGKKHEREIALEAWQRVHVERNPEGLLRGLIHSDGCRFINTGRRWRHPRYTFSNASAGIQRIFCETCEMLGLRWTRAGERTIYVSCKADVARMDEFIGPKA